MEEETVVPEGRPREVVEEAREERGEHAVEETVAVVVEVATVETEEGAATRPCRCRPREAMCWLRKHY